MECVVSALKPSLRGEMAAYIIPANHGVCEEESWPFGGLTSGPTMTAVTASDDFSVDDLLDFSHGELDDGSVLEEGEEKESVSDGVNDDRNSNSSSISCTGSSDDSGTILEGGLPVPDDDIAQLEWVSQFVDDSVYEIPLLYPITQWKQEKNAYDATENRFEPVHLNPPRFSCPVPVKSRSKRPRTARQSMPYQLSESSSSSSSSTSSCSAWSGSSMESLLAKKIKITTHADRTGLVLFQRRCSHCGVQKTPQWRTGPQGAKTLCNACGVRYKSGRLFPEYRPACSPSFSVEIHSNSHRKVLEMRRKKEVGSGEGEMNLMVSGY